MKAKKDFILYRSAFLLTIFVTNLKRIYQSLERELGFNNL